MSDVSLEGKVALITGAGGGLGRSHALLFAARGAKIVVNDLGGSLDGTGDEKSQTPAEKVVDEIKAAGGEAAPNYDSVTDPAGAEKMVETAVKEFGRIDIIVNNAGILRDKSFLKMEEADFDAVIAVHLKGAYNVSKAAWPLLREQGYGRVIMTASAAGLYGNFGQANYSAAKSALIGFGQTLGIEGAKYNIHTNVIAPVARSRMTESILPPEVLEMLQPELVSPLVAWLCSEECETNSQVFEVGGGLVTRLRWTRSAPFTTNPKEGLTPEQVRDNWAKIEDMSDAEICNDLQESIRQFLAHSK